MEHEAAPSETESWDVIVIGGGPAGLSAALTLGRSRRRVLVIDAGEPRNRFAEHMHGVLGADGAPPLEFLAKGRDEVRKLGVQTTRGQVVDVADAGERMHVTLASGQRRAARRIIASSGSRDGLPQIQGLAERWGRDLLHCPYCHGWEVRGQRLGVLATTSASLHQAYLVRQWSDHVILFSAEVGDLTTDVSERLAARNVLVESRPVTRILVSGDEISGVAVEGGDTLAVDALFTTPVLKSNEEYLDGLELEREESRLGGFVKTDRSGRTSNPRVWAIGNVARPAETVPVALAGGASAGAAVNLDLIEEEFDAAVSGRGRPAQLAGPEWVE